MGKQMSFTGLERNTCPGLRSLINRAEDRVDSKTTSATPCGHAEQDLQRAQAENKRRRRKFRSRGGDTTTSAGASLITSLQAAWENSNLKQ